VRLIRWIVSLIHQTWLKVFGKTLASIFVFSAGFMLPGEDPEGEGGLLPRLEGGRHDQNLSGFHR
jgi:hypothetical protein